MKTKTSKLVTMAMLCAMSIVLVWLIRVPFPAAPFLEYDPADIPIIIGTLMFGPGAGFLITVIVSIIQGLTVSAESGIIGIIMHIFATGIYVLTIGFIYKKGNMKSFIISLIAGVIAMTLSMVIWNMIFTPLFMNQPFSAVKAMLLPIIVPFNLMKGGINGVLAYILFAFLKPHLK